MMLQLDLLKISLLSAIVTSKKQIKGRGTMGKKKMGFTEREFIFFNFF